MRAHTRTRRLARSASAAALAAVLAASSGGCGARWTDEQAASVRDRHAAGSGPGAVAAGGTVGGSATGPGTGTPTSVRGGGPAQAGGGAAPGDTVFSGDPAATPGAAAGGPLPCAAPSDAPGVTDTQIVVGEISSLSGPVPGLGESAAAAVRAYVAFRNASGGVCGREIVLREADDGTDIARYRSALQEMAPGVLAITGGFAVGDVGGDVDTLAVPIVNTPTGRTGESPWVFDMNPDPESLDAAIGKYRYLHGQGARRVAMAYLAIDQSRLEASVQRSLMEAAGLQVVDVNELPISTLSFDAAARRAAQSGADYLWAVLDTNGQANFARAVADSGHEWLFREYSYTTYGTPFVELAGSAAEGATSWIRSLPTEEFAANEAMATYVEWMEQVSPGVPQDLFSIDSWVGTKVFFEALEALPGPISREAVVAQLATLESYESGGMFAPISLARERSRGCFLGLIVRSGRWERLAPAGSGFLC